MLTKRVYFSNIKELDNYEISRNNVLLESLFSSWVNKHSFCFGHNLKPNGKTLSVFEEKGTSSEEDSGREKALISLFFLLAMRKIILLSQLSIQQTSK